MGTLVADSGSTKTDWVWSDGNEYINMQSPGLNPHYVKGDYVENILQKNVLTILKDKPVEALFFYGAGCAGEDPVSVLETSFHRIFNKNTQIEINHDLFGAARALYGMKSGIAAILGTGSSSCLFENGVITDRIPSLGFTIGDEGSAGYFGKMFLRHHFYRDWPTDLAEHYSKHFKWSLSEVQTKVYTKPMPNTFVASLAKYLFEKKEHPFVNQLILKGFEEFIEMHLMKYGGENKLAAFVGSLAFFNRDILKVALEKKGLKLHKIIHRPIEDLVSFHLKQL
ncbi:MAG: hypothetical protein EA412_03445 [Chitinophagaceae bacterium]|nr:MAG: hypothetical protein EA412_03445 [Chitinophagaceae bacterium]